MKRIEPPRPTGRKIYVPTGSNGLRVPMREIPLGGSEPPVRLYDTSGPYGDPGYQADLQLINAEFPTPTALHNLYDQLVLWRNHTHVRDVMVAGKWRVRDGQVQDADLEAMRARVHENAIRMWQKAGE